ncbi:MAG: hypothetical protein KGM47_04365 [Acidobacteriota bacterium]|nr:hypothetical protein [Acidobacteriota bacterium]
MQNRRQKFHFAYALIIPCLAIFLLAAGCGYPGRGEREQKVAARASFDPCSLLTNDEVAAAIHADAVDAHRQDGSHCVYKARGHFNMLIVEAARQGADGVFSGLKIANGLMGGSNQGPKVGDESMFWAMGVMFSARRGNGYVTIDMRAANTQSSVAGPELAAKALTRM